MKALIFLFSTIFLISFCIAECNSGQVDINSAYLTDLDKLTGIGPAYAQGIIDSRPYSNVDDLDRVKGIGPKTLEKIKSQGLACVSTGTSIKPEEETSEISSENEIEEDTDSATYTTRVTAKAVQETQIEEPAVMSEEQTESIINLNSDITNVKEKVVYESRSEKIRKYAIYVFAGFLLVIIAFLLFERHGRTKDNRFDDY
jgi:competence ComEA-like helix-hairpin-helix protein